MGTALMIGSDPDISPGRGPAIVTPTILSSYPDLLCIVQLEALAGPARGSEHVLRQLNVEQSFSKGRRITGPVERIFPTAEGRPLISPDDRHHLAVLALGSQHSTAYPCKGRFPRTSASLGVGFLPSSKANWV